MDFSFPVSTHSELNRLVLLSMKTIIDTCNGDFQTAMLCAKCPFEPLTQLIRAMIQHMAAKSNYTGDLICATAEGSDEYTFILTVNATEQDIDSIYQSAADLGAVAKQS